MTLTIWHLIRTLWGFEEGRCCRECGEPIAPSDGFGMSEGVCWPCRREAVA